MSGLATNPNPNGLPAGSCAVALNVVSRQPGCLSPLPTNVPQLENDGIGYTSRKLLWSDADTGVVVVRSDHDSIVWTPGENETMIGELACATVNQNVTNQQWVLDELPIGYNAGTGLTDYRDIGFLPGLTQSAFSHFRTIVTEKWGNVVSTGGARRWAGLLPPKVYATPTTLTHGTGWFLDGNSVLYRAFYSLESTNTEKPYIVQGPVSSVVAAFASIDEEVQLQVSIPGDEPFIVTDECKVYINIFRSTQDDVESAQELPYDFRQILKQEVTVANISLVSIDDNVTDLARANGIALYTNSTEQGEDSSGYCPPCARDVVVFRDTAFYANRASLPALSVTVPGPMLFASGGLFSDDDRATGIGYRAFTGSMTNGLTTFTIATPAQLLGLAIGQTITFTGGIQRTITNIVGSTITVNTAWTGSTASVAGIAHDAVKVKVYYADGTTFTTSGDIIFIDVYGSNLPGFRVFLPISVGYPLPAEGGKLTFVFTYPAIKRVLYFEMAFTNGQNYSPPYTGDFTTFTNPFRSLVDTRPNRLFYSKAGQPEEVPLTNYNDIGAGTILKCWATQSALLCLCTDGLWRLTGDGSSWQVTQIDPTVLLVHPDCVGSLNNVIYAWVQDGLSTISEDGAVTISTDAVGPTIRDWHTKLSRNGAPYVWGPSVVGDSYWNEVWLNVFRGTGTDDTGYFDATLIYNTDTKNFTEQIATQFRACVFSPDATRLLMITPQGGLTDYATTLTSFTDFDPDQPQNYQQALVWFNALQSDDKGKLKQWMDVSYFVANIEETVTYNGIDYLSFMKALFDARNTSTDPLIADLDVNVQSMVELSRDIHFWIPRRAVLSDQIQLGVLFKAAPEVEEGSAMISFNFQLQGFTVRYRVASDTLKR